MKCHIQGKKLFTDFSFTKWAAGDCRFTLVNIFVLYWFISQQVNRKYYQNYINISRFKWIGIFPVVKSGIVSRSASWVRPWQLNADRSWGNPVWTFPKNSKVASYSGKWAHCTKAGWLENFLASPICEQGPSLDVGSVCHLHRIPAVSWTRSLSAPPCAWELIHETLGAL